MSGCSQLAALPQPAPPAPRPRQGGRTLQQLFQQQPHECALIVIRTLWVGSVLFVGLVCHSLAILHRFWHVADGPVDGFLRVSVLLRVIAAAPRPLFWIQMGRLYAEARQEPTPRQVADRLAEVQESRLVRANAQFSKCFHVWLAVNLLLSGWFRDGTGGLCDHVFLHCLLVIAAIIFIKVLTVATFFRLLHSDIDRGVQRRTLEANATLRPSREEDLEEMCTICVSKFVTGCTIRELRCGHFFHSPCVDKWLIKYSNKCPLCMSPVGPPAREKGQ